MRRLLAPLILAAVVLLASCAPVAGGIADLVERNDGAALTYVLSSAPGGPGLAFDPGEALARGVIVRAEGDELQLLSVPEGAVCTVETDKLDCRLGDVTDTTLIGVTGGNVVANATWRRVGASTVFLTFAQLPEPILETQRGTP